MSTTQKTYEIVCPRPEKPVIFVFYGTFDDFFFLRYNVIINMKEEMRMSILEEFWYGNLDPAEYDASPSEEYKELKNLFQRKHNAPGSESEPGALLLNIVIFVTGK